MDQSMSPAPPASSPRPAMSEDDVTDMQSPSLAASSKRKALAISASDDEVKVATPMKTKTPATRPKQTKRPGKAPNKSIPIPRSVEECGELDAMLVKMRDSDQTWETIRQAWEEKTGEKIGKSTLPNRYQRVKANFTILNEEDNRILIEAKQKVEDEYEKQKWYLVNQEMVKHGTPNYGGAALQQQYKRLMAQGESLKTDPKAEIKLDYDVDENGDA